MGAAAHLHVLRAAAQERRNQRGRLADATHRGVWVLFLAALLFIGGGRHGYGLMLALVVTLAALVMWSEQFSSLCRQNHPNAARLVPGHARVLRETAVVLWLLATALSGGALAWVTGLGLLGPLVTGPVLLYAALWIGRVWLASWLTMGLSLWASFFPRDLYDFIRRVPSSWEQAAQLPLVVGVLLVSAWLLCLLLRDGNPAHRRAHASRRRSKLASESSASGRSMLRHTGRIGETLILLMEMPQRAWARWLLARATPTARSALARADLVLGAHWVQQLGGLAIFLTVAGASAAVAWFGFGLDFWRFRGHASFGVGIGFTCAALGPIVTLVGSLHATRREQALLMLLPGMPRAAALNRHLARRHAIRIVLGWSAAMLMLGGLNWGTPTFHQALAFGAAGLPVAMLTVLRDWSRLRVSSAGRQAWGVMLTFGAGLLAAWLAREFAIMALVLPPALVALGLAIALLRWQRAGRLPQALPAGRLAA